MCAHEVDLSVVRMMAARWLHAEHEARRARGDKHLLSCIDDGMAGTLAQDLAGVEHRISADKHPSSVHAHLVNRSGSIFDAGFEFGLAVAIAIVQEPLSDSRPRWMDALDVAQHEIDTCIEGATDDAEAA